MTFNKPGGFVKPSTSCHDTDNKSERGAMCRAHECPNRWTVGPACLCSAHAWADPDDWPMITVKQQKLLQQKQNEKKENAKPSKLRSATPEEMQRIRQVLSGLKARNKDHKAWMHYWQERAKSGEPLTPMQRQFLEAAQRGLNKSQNNS